MAYQDFDAGAVATMQGGGQGAADQPRESNLDSIASGWVNCRQCPMSGRQAASPATSALPARGISLASPSFPSPGSVTDFRPSRQVTSYPNLPLPPVQPPQQAPGRRVRHTPSTLDELVGGDARIEAAVQKVRKIVGKDIPLLVEGETGTGKEMFAQAFHMSGPRRDKPFIAVNCAAIPEGLIESELFGYQEGAFTGARKKGNLGKILQADGGTLFLDEIGDMPFNLQARLLRVLQEREVVPLGAARAVPVDIVLVTATNRKLREEVERGNFREDLYYRVNGLRITLPPLRERTDLDRIARALLMDEAGLARRVDISEDVLELFRAYRWPGNIRQMRSILRTALALLDGGERLEAEHLPEDIVEEIAWAAGAAGHAAAGHGTAPAGVAAAPAEPVAARPLPVGVANLAEIELAAIHRALDDCQGNVSAAARRLGISRNTLYRKLGRL